MSAAAENLVRILRAGRFDLSNEKLAQEQVQAHLTRSGVLFSREHRLSGADIVDFFAERVAIEVKLKGAIKIRVYKQMRRYAQSPDVDALILLTNLSMGLPTQIEGKPAYYVSMGQAWL